MDQGDTVSRADRAREKPRESEHTAIGNAFPTSGQTQQGVAVQRRWKRLMDIIDR